MTTNSYSNPDSENPQYPNWRDLDLSTPEGRYALNREIARRRNQDPAETYDWAYNYANSVDAALTLISDVPRVNLALFGTDKRTWEVELTYPGERQVVKYAPTPALAICKAWLAMMDAKGGVK